MDLLLVDDRQENLLALEAVLGTSGHRLIQVRSGDEALRYLLDHEPALILMDVQMPGLDGYETAAIIKGSERTREIPIIFITALNPDERFAQRGYEHGAVDYIYKPYDPRILRSKVSVFVELARKTRRLVQAERKLLENERRERERQLAQLELKGLRREQADQRKYLELVEGINHGIVWAADPADFHFTFVSSSAERILGYPVDQWSAEEGFLAKRLFPEERDRFFEAIRAIEDGAPEIGLEHRFITPDRREVWLHTGFRLGPKGEEPGRKREIRGLSVDITQIKQAEAALRKNKLRSDFLAEASLLLSESLDYGTTLSRLGNLAVPRLADGYSVFMRDAEGRPRLLAISRENPEDAGQLQRLERRFPIDPAGTRGIANVMRTGMPELLREVDDEFLVAIASNDEQLALLRRAKIRSAMIVPLVARGKTIGAMSLMLTRSGPVYDESDLAFALDLARRAASAIENSNLYQEAQAAVRTRDEFLSIASHELKTPLTPLKIQTQALLRALSAGGELKVERVAKIVQTSERQIGRLARLIDDLLDISRIGVGKLSLTLERVDVAELVRDIVDRFCGQGSEARCELEVRGGGAIWIEADRLRIEQVVINLLTNAIKYGPGKPVQVTVAQEGKYATLAFRDQGIGIAKEDQSRIFGRFERAVSGNHFGGLGLGLYIVHQILAAHAATISVESELGVGSVFRVRLPSSAAN